MIDVSFDFTTDTPGYYDPTKKVQRDPDIYSPTLRRYHRLLWSRTLPNGEKMNLKEGKSPAYDYLSWKNFRFASDTIIVDFNYATYKQIIDQVKQKVGDYKSYFENLTRRSYTIGGAVIFPKHPNSMNQAKGINSRIADRWDLTLECIRRYYIGQNSPLSKVIDGDKDFFDLFGNFRGYVDFFFLQDAVTDDYSNVNIWCGNPNFDVEKGRTGLPQTVEEYFTFIENEYEFLDRRNKRIKEYCESHMK